MLLVSTLAFAILVALGTWQVERLQWKEALLASIAERTAAAPQPLAAIEARFRDTGDVEYWPVSVTGTFDHTRERHFFATWQGQTGYYVYTPLMLEDGRAVFVNRGFVPFELKESAKRQQGLIPGRVTITGLARNPLAEKPSSLVPDNDLAKNIFYWKDRDRMVESAGLPTGDRLVPFFIDAGPGAAPGGWPVGGVTIVDLPNNHLQYAVTWYGLAAALLGVVVVWLLRARRAP
ncbi:SURF1 family protein [Mesorhizobium sp. RP14(2022)]|uniref:SURF1-like protein n=1 Tax=Mesorhizobium liriopis TaxID=2953882 RepID=A0ABT1C144_9HYPH|nr:SURF1 family protein [Mesorhizobium liriopis]